MTIRLLFLAEDRGRTIADHAGNLARNQGIAVAAVGVGPGEASNKVLAEQFDSKMIDIISAVCVVKTGGRQEEKVQQVLKLREQEVPVNILGGTGPFESSCYFDCQSTDS